MRFLAIFDMIFILFLLTFVGFSIAGEGGSVYLINLSGSDWRVTHRESHVMNDWKFPDYLKNGDTARVYVEFKHNSKSVNARVDYELVGSNGKSFQIFAHGKPRRLEAVYNNMEIDGQPKGMRRGLGWRHNGDTNFIIIGKNGRYTGTSLDGSNWMKNNIDVLGGRTLRQISIPGSHDAGMSRLDGHTAFGRTCNVLTQSHSVGEQLNLGIRYFDIRPVIGNGGKFLTGHYTHIKGSWQGGNGQSIASIINDLNDFTRNHNELIVIILSHSLNSDVGHNKYRKFNQAEWENLFKQLDTINFLYNNENSNVHLDQIILSDYTNHGSRASVVIIIDDPDSKVQLGSRLGKGFFMPDNFDIYDDYSNTNDWSKMIKDQINKMHQYSEKRYFLLSWTLTQNGFQAAICKPSVKDLADKANIHLGSFLYKEVSASSYPNIILVDNVKDTDVTSMALAISVKIMS
ncbi:uncharacterized protein [Halyomorpha halys]|uniref:uncharacterized protein n=1 Tax=Halyomorpha halys TaxID=286706 RepID=UPI0006D4D881|nr:uncharacterized protein LOC106687435 [Halyomorpha halys]